MPVDLHNRLEIRILCIIDLILVVNMKSFVSVRFGSKHPDSVVETSSLSSVVPQDIHYKLSIPEHILDNGELSALQLEAIVYASQRQETIMPNGERAGFLIGWSS